MWEFIWVFPKMVVPPNLIIIFNIKTHGFVGVSPTILRVETPMLAGFLKHQHQGGGFKYFLFSPLPAEMIQFDEHIFQMAWFNHQPDTLDGWNLPTLRFFTSSWSSILHSTLERTVGSTVVCGDSSRDLFIPKRWRSLNPLQGSLNHTKKVTLNHQGVWFSWLFPFPWKLGWVERCLLENTVNRVFFESRISFESWVIVCLFHTHAPNLPTLRCFIINLNYHLSLYHLWELHRLTWSHGVPIEQWPVRQRFLAVGDDILPKYVYKDCKKPWNKDPYKPIKISLNVSQGSKGFVAVTSIGLLALFQKLPAVKHGIFIGEAATKSHQPAIFQVNMQCHGHLKNELLGFVLTFLQSFFYHGKYHH